MLCKGRHEPGQDAGLVCSCGGKEPPRPRKNHHSGAHKQRPRRKARGCSGLASCCAAGKVHTSRLRFLLSALLRYVTGRLARATRRKRDDKNKERENTKEEKKKLLPTFTFIFQSSSPDCRHGPPLRPLPFPPVPFPSSSSVLFHSCTPALKLSRQCQRTTGRDPLFFAVSLFSLYFFFSFSFSIFFFSDPLLRPRAVVASKHDARLV